MQGNSIAQAFQFVDTGNAEVWLCRALAGHQRARLALAGAAGSLHAIRQDAVLLKKGADSEAAKAFLTFLKGPEARAIIEKYGYAIGAAS